MVKKREAGKTEEEVREDIELITKIKSNDKKWSERF